MLNSDYLRFEIVLSLDLNVVVIGDTLPASTSSTIYKGDGAEKLGSICYTIYVVSIIACKTIDDNIMS